MRRAPPACSSRGVSTTSLVFTLERMAGIAGAEERARELLNGEAIDIREAAARYLASVLDDGALEEELEQYLSRDSYYYNVVGLWDAALYGSNAIRAVYRLAPRPAAR
jgi:hypothetical protein